MTDPRLEALRLQVGDVVVLQTPNPGTVSRKFLDEWNRHLKRTNLRDSVILVTTEPGELLEKLNEEQKLVLYRHLERHLRRRSPVDLIPHLPPDDRTLKERGEYLVAPIQRTIRRTKHFLFRDAKHRGRTIRAWTIFEGQGPCVVALLEPLSSEEQALRDGSYDHANTRVEPDPSEKNAGREEFL